MRRSFFIVLFTAGTGYLFAQDNCPQQPAPCAHSAEINTAMDFAGRTKDNVSFPQELDMENKIRDAVTGEVQRIAKAKGWSVYEVNEQGGNYSPPYIYISHAAWEATPFNKRTPDNYLISFIFITNKDSLEAWKEYLLNGFQEESKNATLQAAGIYNDTQYRAYSDSLQLNMKQAIQFAQEDNAAYMQALKTNNRKVIDAHAQKQDAFRARSERYQNKLEAIQQSYRQPYDNAQQSWYKKMNRFAESSITLINFDINPFSAGYFDVQQGVDVNKLPKRKLSVPGAFSAGILSTGVQPNNNNYTIGSYSFLFQAPSYDASIMFGNYLPPDEYGHYKPAFTKNHHDKQSVLGNVKTITCDKVQNIEVHIEGSNNNIDSLVASLDWSKIYKMIDVKN